MGVGVEAVITDRDLALVGDMGGDPGDELQVVHPLHLSGLAPVPVAHLGSLFIEGEAFQGKKRPDHVFSHPLGLGLCLSLDPAVDIEARVAPGKQTFGPFGTEELLANEISQELAGKDFHQP